MIRIKLTAEDAQRLGVSESVEYDNDKPRLREIRELKRQAGLTWEQLGQQLATGDLEAAALLVWVALVRQGLSVAWNDFDLELTGTDMKLVDADPKEKPTS